MPRMAVCLYWVTGSEMSTLIPLMALDRPGDEVLAWLSQHMTAEGLRLARTFDLQAARLPHHDCSCPHHGTEQCDCQMVILLVYGHGHHPVSLVAHAHNGQTWFSMVDTPQQRADSHIVAAIRQVLVPNSYGNHGVMQHE